MMKFILLIFLICKINSEQFHLQVFENGFNSTEFNITLISKLNNFKEDFWSKIAIIKEEKDIEKLIAISPVFNRKWLLYFYNEKGLKIIKRTTFPETAKIQIYGLLTNWTNLSPGLQKDLNYSVASVDEKDIDYINDNTENEIYPCEGKEAAHCFTPG